MSAWLTDSVCVVLRVYQRCCYTRTVCWCILWIDLVKWHARPEWIAKFLNVQLSQLLSQTVRPVKQFIRCWPCVSGKSKVSLTMPTTFDEYSNNVQTWQWPVCRSVRAVSQWLVNEEREISEELGLTHVAYSHGIHETYISVILSTGLHLVVGLYLLSVLVVNEHSVSWVLVHNRETLIHLHFTRPHYTDEWLTSSVNASVPVVWSEWPIRTGVWN